MIDALPLLLSDEGYQISRSVRLRSSASAYFNRTPGSASNRTTWTWSGWVKGGLLGDYQLFGARAAGTDTDMTYIGFNSNRLSIYGSATNWRITTQVFRDPSAWYHIVVTADTSNATANNRLRIYVNGVEVTAFSTINNPALSASLGINSTGQHQIGVALNVAGSSYILYLDGYLTEVNFIDGQALTPASFGETNAVTGVWQPKKYAGTYGTNGFYLNFSDNSAATAAAIGKDYSGNGNNWTPNNISVTAGATYDSMLDVPTQWADGGNGRGNYCTFNPLFKLGGTAASTWALNGNLQAKSDTNASLVVYGTMGLDPNTRFYSEFTITNTVEVNDHVGIVTDIQAAADSGTCIAYKADGQKIVNGTTSSYGATYTDNDVIGIAVDLVNNQVTFYKNGTSQGAITGVTSATYFHRVRFNNLAGQQAEVNANWGQRPFSYTPPTGFKALNTLNLPIPTILKGNQYFNAVLWTGDGSGSSRTISNVGFQPDFVWTKSRTETWQHLLYDAVRGAGNESELASSSTAAEGGVNANLYGYLSAFSSDGMTFTSGTDGTADQRGYYNKSGQTYVAWNWKEGATQGFDIVTYTGTGSATTVAHNLGVTPSMIIVKERGNARFWFVNHISLSATQNLYLNGTDSVQSDSVFTSRSSTTFGVGAGVGTNGSGQTYVAYLFAAVSGYSAFGSYTGNGSADGPFVFCGFRPRWIMFKKTNATSNWSILDTARDEFNVADNPLLPNLSNAESTSTSTSGAFADILSNGFKARGNSGDINDSGATYIFAAFSEVGFKYALGR